MAISGSSTTSFRIESSARTESTTSRWRSAEVPLGPAQVEDRVALGVKSDALEPAGEKPAVPLSRGDRLGLAEVPVGGEDDEAREVLALASQAVVDPGSHRRPAGDRRAGVHERMRRVVVDRLGHHRADDADLVGDRAQVRQDRADLLATGSAAAKRMLGSETDQLLPLELSDRHALGERLRHRLAVHLGERRLGVERLQMRGAAGHVQIDDAFGLGGEVERMDDSRPVVGRSGAFGSSQQFRVEQRRQGERPDPRGRAAQERPAMNAVHRILEIVRHKRVLHQSYRPHSLMHHSPITLELRRRFAAREAWSWPQSPRARPEERPRIWSQSSI